MEILGPGFQQPWRMFMVTWNATWSKVWNKPYENVESNGEEALRKPYEANEC